VAVAVVKTDIPTFPAAVIEQQIRELLAEEAKVQATLRGTGGGGGGTFSEKSSRAEPDIDSLVAVEVLTVIEPFVPFNLPESLIRPGGYTSVNDFINDLLPRVHNRWHRYHEGKKR
jgi:hypothetical protein